MAPTQKPMTSENRMDALFSYQKPDRVPIGPQWMSIGFNTVSTGGTVAEAYDDPVKSFHAFLKVADRFGWDQYIPLLSAYCFRCSGFWRQRPAAKRRIRRGADRRDRIP